MSVAAIRIEGLCKRFGDADVLRDVTLEVRPREVIGLVGENGAGKSTLLKLLAGVLRPEGGSIALRGAPVRWRSVGNAAAAGIGLMPQEPALVPGLTVAENVLLGHEGAGVRFGIVRWRTLLARAQALLAALDATIAPAAKTQSLSFHELQMVAFARALAVATGTREAPILLLDEPTAALDGSGAAAILHAVERLRDRASVVFVSHRLDEVLRVCDRIVVLKNGRSVAERDAATTTAGELQRLMVGGLVGTEGRRAPARRLVSETPCLEVQALCRRRAYADVSLALRPGEVIGLTGAAGSGCRELGRTLFGIDAPESGTISIDSRTVVLRDPLDAVALGIGYVAADRASEGVIGAMTVAENMMLVAVAHGASRRIDRRREQAVVARWLERLRIATPSAATRMSELSGGNQQKVALAKWLVGARPRVLILDDPLRALDARARSDIVEAIRELAAEGVAIVVVADALDELLAACDTVIAMKDGRICARHSMAGDGAAAQPVLERAN